MFSFHPAKGYLAQPAVEATEGGVWLSTASLGNGWVGLWCWCVFGRMR